ncbi:MAG: Ppx/GppA family phosphatase [Methylocystis sp.]|nr:Ppx/GppA family phosphatase [Methylocystis sp.]MCA3584478.1 Ppx/GppA family phosphatase [Methylocystis sp.]MCA3588019.1 Ppx/GppA family phosphatase [Methylocystis sp.]MCA3590500.1 Ppx/GppA family phosphatase [Methylocystis sp.]
MLKRCSLRREADANGGLARAASQTACLWPNIPFSIDKIPVSSAGIDRRLSTAWRKIVKSRLWKPPAQPVAKLRAFPPVEALDAGIYGALDLGTNNCRLLIARANPAGFRILDSFSRIVRLGEGLGSTGRLAEGAIGRTIDALKACKERLDERRVGNRRLIATEACRAAANGEAFLDAVFQETGLRLEIIDRQAEAELAAAGCAVLMSRSAESVLLFDIGGGSTEVVWLASDRYGTSIGQRIRHWTSLPVGVVTLSEKHGGIDVSHGIYESMVEEVAAMLRPFSDGIDSRRLGRNFHLLGTSGTVTTIAAMHLKLPRYDRRQVDGLWMRTEEARQVIADLMATPYQRRADNPCIGSDRADLVIAGCAIYDAIARTFPAEHIRVADRGLREGILMQMMMRNGVWLADRRARP